LLGRCTFYNFTPGQQPLDIVGHSLRHRNFIASAHGLPLIFWTALTGPAGLLFQVATTDAAFLVLSELAGFTYGQSGLLFVSGHFLTPQEVLEQCYDESEQPHVNIFINTSPAMDRATPMAANAVLTTGPNDTFAVVVVLWSHQPF